MTPQRVIRRSLAALALLALVQGRMVAEEGPANALTMAVDGYFDAWVNGRISAMVSYLTPDSEYHPHGGATVTGREALRTFYQDFIDNYDINLAWQYEQTELHGDTGFVMGVYFIRYAPTGSREEIARGGRFFMDMRLGADGQWRIRRELTQTTADTLPELTP